MPEPIQTAEQSTRLASLFKLKGRLPMSLDEIIVPVVLVGDTTEADVPPPAFGTPPGPDLAMRAFILRGTAAHAGDVEGLVIQAGQRPCIIESITAYFTVGELLGIFPGRIAAGGSIGIVTGGDWAARRQGQASVSFETVAAPVAANIGPPEPLAIVPFSNSLGRELEYKLGIALQQGEGDFSAISIFPLNGDTNGMWTVATGSSDSYLGVKWRE